MHLQGKCKGYCDYLICATNIVSNKKKNHSPPAPEICFKYATMSLYVFFFLIEIKFSIE